MTQYFWQYRVCSELIFVDHFLHVNSSFISNWESHKMEHFCPCSKKYLPSSLTTKQPGSYHSKLIPFLGAWQPGLVHWVVPHDQLLNSEHALLKKRSGGSVARLGDNISVDNRIDTNQTGTQLSIWRKICFCKGQSRFRKRIRVIRCRWDVSLSSGRMLLLEARKALKEKRQRLAGLIQKFLGIILMVSYKRTGLN